MSPTGQESGHQELVMAIPAQAGRLCSHFGHCGYFALLEVDRGSRQVLRSRQLEPPAHQPGVYPRWLHDQGVELVIAGGMGQRAQDIFHEHGIEVIVGAPEVSVEEVAQSYLDGKLQPGENICDH